ncbi:MAG TPA: MarR family transcriptional regulator [Longimicrobiales bacterium]|nr:MarR family transcriptional regulator [Longimicrobiales bacterium]
MTSPTSSRPAPDAPHELEASPAERRALRLWVTLARAYGAVARLSAADIARHGLSPSEFAVLEALYHKGPLLQGQVQEKVLVSSGGITYLVDRLVERGLVERRLCESDRRARYAALTGAGEALMADIFPDHAAAVRAAVGGLTAREQELATELLKRLGRRAAAAAEDAEG